MSETLPHTYMAVSSDLGDSLDVHPTRKFEVAQRLALSALCHTYNYHLTGSGPRYLSFTANGSQATLRFADAENMHPANGTTLMGVEVAGADGIYHKAEAKPQGEECIVLNCPEVRQIKAVRYGWQPFTRANLVNDAGLPASTFRDEQF